jgi:hypothetical protein
MKPAFWARKAHKWIGLVIGVQALLWMCSGLYMTSISIDVIHGDHLAHVEHAPLERSQVRVTPQALSKRFPGMQRFRLKRFLSMQVYEVQHDAGISLVDAASGKTLSPLPEPAIRKAALALYQGKAPVRSVSLLRQAPQEVQGRPVPLWQVRFADRGDTTLYLSPDTGELLAKRHSLWRWFDFLWMFHIMDYEARTDVNNPLLRIATVVGLLFALSGVWLLFYSFGKRRAAT